MRDTHNLLEEAESGTSSRDAGSVQVISRAVNILWVLRDHPEGLSPSAIAKQVGLARTTVYRIVSTLAAEHLISWSGSTNKARLGLGLASLGLAVNMDLRRELHPYLEKLSRELDETVDLAILDRKMALFIDQISTPQRLQAVSGVGSTFPLYSTANGKAMLSLLGKDRAQALLPPILTADTPHTIVDKERLSDELETIRRDGLAYDREEHTLGICAVGIAFYDPLGTLAAITVPVPSIRFYGNEDRLGKALKKTGAQIQDMFSKYSPSAWTV